MILQLIRQFWYFIPTWLLAMTYAYFSYKNKEIGGPKWFFLLWGANLIPVWLIICQYSDNLIRDGMIYSTILLVGYVSTMIWLGESESFSNYQMFGIALAIVGYVFIQKG